MSRRLRIQQPYDRLLGILLNSGWKFSYYVSLGNNSTIQVMEKGTVDIKTRNGFVESISNVFYIPDLKASLLSIGQLQEKGYVITFQNDES